MRYEHPNRRITDLQESVQFELVSVNQLKPINMDVGEWRQFSKGQHWRSDKAYLCHVCHCLSNEFYMFAPYYEHAKLVCPGEEKFSRLHEELDQKVWNSHESKHPSSYVKSLRREIGQIRDKFKVAEPNIIGIVHDPKAKLGIWGGFRD